MRINEYFDKVLGVQPVNQRWSWGAVDDFNCRVFLRVWTDELTTHQGIECIAVGSDYGEDYFSAGIAERRRHLELMDKGYIAYGVLCTPRFIDNKKKIASFDEHVLLKLGRKRKRKLDILVEIVDRVPVQHLKRSSGSSKAIDKDIQAVRMSQITRTQVESLVQARIGQGQFRKQVLAAWENRCCVTGCRVEAAIRASHIKPWSESTNEERLDPSNGLPLIANLDALFDSGLISFSDDGRILCSRSLTKESREILGLSHLFRLRGGLPQNSQSYLCYHRLKHGYD